MPLFGLYSTMIGREEVVEDELEDEAFEDEVEVLEDEVLEVQPEFEDDDLGDESGSAYVFVVKKTNGDPCANDDECLSGFCVDGVCCNSDCLGDCRLSPFALRSREYRRDLSEQHPDKLEFLKTLWYHEAGKYQGFPLEDRGPVEVLTTPRPQLAPPRGVVEGHVREAGTAAPLQATIHVPGAPPMTTSDPDSGAYALHLPEGTHVVRAESPAHRWTDPLAGTSTNGPAGGRRRMVQRQQNRVL